jgi:outer membrane biosynthesis protein TonB
VTVKCRENPAPRAFSRLGGIAAPLAFSLALVAALALTSCGGGDDARLLPGATAREITANLDAVEQLAEEGECAGAEGAAEEVSTQVEALQGIEPELKRALEQGAARLNEVVVGCEATVEELPPTTVPDAHADEAEEKAREQEEKEREKEEKEREKEEEREEEEKGPTGPTEEVPPPHSNGDGKGAGEESGEGPSGGISPSDAVGD